jgi:nucleoside-diphosphate-sugar epimerase
MRVAVTGAGGRVGTAVVDLLVARGHGVVAIDRSFPSGRPLLNGVSTRELDASDFDALRLSLAGCDALVHLAAIPGPGRQHDAKVHNNNVTASYNAMRAAVEVGIDRVCQASSINAIGAAFSRVPRFDYLPLDTAHPTYNEDPYSLSKWICEQQADSIARRYQDVSVTSLRFHLIAADEGTARSVTERNPAHAVRHLWGWTSFAAAARACCLAVEAYQPGHRVLFVVSPRHVGPAPAEELLQTYYPHVPLRCPITGDEGFFDCSDGPQSLGWRDDNDGAHNHGRD